MPGVSMFTIKHYTAKGVLKVCSCEKFETDVDQPHEVRINSRATGPELVVLGAGDSVYIENMHGKTIAIARG